MMMKTTHASRMQSAEAIKLNPLTAVTDFFLCHSHVPVPVLDFLHIYNTSRLQFEGVILEQMCMTIETYVARKKPTLVLSKMH